MTVAESAAPGRVLAETVSTPAETCPRCHTTEPWGESSWCPRCNYYPVVDRGMADGKSWQDDLPELPQEEEIDDRSALASIPIWFWVMLAGVVSITAFSVAIRSIFPDEDSPRGLIAIGQLVLGALTVLSAHLMAARYALKNDRRLNFNDILLCWFNIWQPTIARLPEACKRIQAMIWGIVAVLTAVTIIGGIDYSAPFRTHAAPKVKPLKLIGSVAAAAKAQGSESGPVTMDEALADLQSEVNAMSEAGLQDAMNGGMSTMEDALKEISDMPSQLSGMNDVSIEDISKGVKTFNCFIYGVETDKTNTPVALLFAMKVGNEDQHVARLETKNVPHLDLRDIVAELSTAIQEESVVATSYEALWVAPVVTCRLAFDGLTDDGELIDVKFEAIIIRQRGLYDTDR